MEGINHGVERHSVGNRVNGIVTALHDDQWLSPYAYGEN